MPTPLELLLDPITLTAIGIYIALIVWEALAPARRLPAVRGWRGRALLSFIVYLLISGYLPWLWADLAGSLRLFDLTSLPTWAGATIGVLVYELGAWIYHRALHGSSFLWRCVHQWHHSSERLDAWSAFWFSPYDMAGWTALASFALSIVVGLSPEATFAAVVTITFFTIFQHTNVRTPRWLGYIVQRTREPLLASCARRACRELFGPARLRSVVRHAEQSTRLRARAGLLRRCVQPTDRHAARP